MSKHVSAFPSLQFTPDDRSEPTSWRLFAEIVLPAAAIVILLVMIAIGIPFVNIFEIGLVAVMGILAHALWHSPEAALKQLKIGVKAFVIAGLLSIIPAHVVSALTGNGGLFSPAAQLPLAEFSLYSALVFSVLLTFYYWVIFATWDNQYHGQPQQMWLTILSASLLVIGAQVVWTLVSGGVLVLLFSLVILVLMFFPPLLWIMELEQEE